ncbi:MAG: hypothetical protein OEP95_08840 [Myxococcales bacterium]|nr:hypothetical protein [Myxococcales bacterium]
MTARKSAKKPAKKKAAVKKKAAAKKKTSAKKAAPKKTESTAQDAEAPAKPAKQTKKGTVVAKDVNLGHVFALRPRVRTSFRQPDFLRARDLLEDERYETTADAARAVALKALELTHDGPQEGRGKKSKRSG